MAVSAQRSPQFPSRAPQQPPQSTLRVSPQPPPQHHIPQAPPLRVNNRLHPEDPVTTSVNTPPAGPPPQGAPSLRDTQIILANNPGMHVLNKRIMTDVFVDPQTNEVVCTFCLLQVLSFVHQLGNATVRREVKSALASEEPGELAEALLWAASAETKTLAGSLLGYYQQDEPLTCDSQQSSRPFSRSQPLDDRCRRINEFVSDEGRPVDFKQQSTTGQINAVVEQATGGRIKNLFPQLGADTKLVFVSALVFKDSWRSGMIPEPGTFKLSSGQSVQTEMLMLREDLPILDGKADGVIGVSLPYEQPGVRMFLFTTIDGTDIRHRLEQHHYERLTKGDLTYTRVTMPSFNIQSKKSSYVDLITNMGMGTMFDGGMGAFDKLKVSKLVHKAVIRADKDGTEAAGAAGVAVVALSAKPQPFQARFDRPFISSLVHTELGVPIFTTYVAHPRRQ